MKKIEDGKCATVSITIAFHEVRQGIYYPNESVKQVQISGGLDNIIEESLHQLESVVELNRTSSKVENNTGEGKPRLSGGKPLSYDDLESLTNQKKDI